MGEHGARGGGPVTLAISVLGPLSLDRSGAPVELGGAKLRLLLGVLIAHRRSPLTPDQICDALWPQEPPRSATATLQSYLSRLRRVLMAEATVELHESRYELVTAPGSVDADRFEQAIVDVSDALPAESVKSTLGPALSCWRGPAFGDLADEQLDTSRGGTPRRAAHVRHRALDRGPPGRGRGPRAGRRPRTARRRAPVARGLLAPADARPVPLGSPGRGPASGHRSGSHAPQRARSRPVTGGPSAGTPDARRRPLAPGGAATGVVLGRRGRRADTAGRPRRRPGPTLGTARRRAPRHADRPGRRRQDPSGAPPRGRPIGERRDGDDGRADRRQRRGHGRGDRGQGARRAAPGRHR